MLKNGINMNHKSSDSHVFCIYSYLHVFFSNDRYGNDRLAEVWLLQCSFRFTGFEYTPIGNNLEKEQPCFKCFIGIGKFRGKTVVSACLHSYV